MWELLKKHCPIRKLCLFIARQFVETAKLVRVVVDFHTGKGCNRPIEKQ